MKILFSGGESAIHSVYGPKITTLKMQREKKILLTTNRAIYIVAFDGIILAQNFDNSFELQSSLVRCCSRTPLVRKSCFLAAPAGFYGLQNLSAIYGRLWHILASTVPQNKRFQYNESPPNFDLVGGTQQKFFFQFFHEVSKIRAICILTTTTE